jgi:hypothetical protein
MRIRQAQAIRHRVSLGLTLIELVVFVAMIVCVVEGGGIGHRIVGGRFGWLLGGFSGCFSFFLALAALVLLMDFWVGGVPRLPKCRNGCCCGPGMFRGHGDYTHRKVGDEYHLVCGCGIRHERRGRRFVVVNDDGTETRYLVWRPFRGWFPDGSDR